MNTPQTFRDERHEPSAAFVSSLEREIVRTYREQSRSPVVGVSRWGSRLRAASLLMTGLVLGAGAPLASAQVQASQLRTQLERAAEVDRQLAAARLALAQASHETTRQAYDAGALSKQSLLESAAEIRMAEMRIARLNLDIAEIRASAAAPRDELWAPLVRDRDFVKERLQLSAAAAQERLTQSESALADVERSASIGASTARSLSESSAVVANATREFQVLAQKLLLRERFVKEGLQPEALARLVQRAELIAEVTRVRRLIALTTSRLALVKDRFAVGMSTAIDVKRAEVELLELQAEQARLGLQLQQLQQLGGREQ